VPDSLGGAPTGRLLCAGSTRHRDGHHRRTCAGARRGDGHRTSPGRRHRPAGRSGSTSTAAGSPVRWAGSAGRASRGRWPAWASSSHCWCSRPAGRSAPTAIPSPAAGRRHPACPRPTTRPEGRRRRPHRTRASRRRRSRQRRSRPTPRRRVRRLRPHRAVRARRRPRPRRRPAVQPRRRPRRRCTTRTAAPSGPPVRTPCTAVSPVTRRGWTRTGTASPVPAAARGCLVRRGSGSRGCRPRTPGCCATWRRPGSDAVRVVAEVRALTCVIRGQRARGVGGTA
jgi:hypothetical protein